MLFFDCVDNFELEVFGVVLICHIAPYDALKQVFIDASGGDMVDDCLHTLNLCIERFSEIIFSFKI